MQPNPYDPRGPVTKRSCFAGRKAELHEAEYSLNSLMRGENESTPRALLIIGERRSGKSSLMNVIQTMAQDRKISVVRLDLDSGDCATPSHFFARLFFNTLEMVFAEKPDAFGERSKEILAVCRTIADTGILPNPIPQIPFRVPVQYAAAAAGEALAPNCDTLVVDLQLLQERVSNPIVLLLDECDGLARPEQRVILERLRNAMQRLKKYMFVLAGTQKLQLGIAEVFSATTQQFKTLRLNGYRRVDDTARCIIKPLQDVGIDPDDLLQATSFAALLDIHHLCSGRPYEIQLICYHMYKRVEEGLEKRMRLNVQALENVRVDLDQSPEAATGPALRGINRLPSKQLRPLRVFCACDGKLTLDEVFRVEQCFFGDARYSRQKLQEAFDLYLQAEILEQDAGIIRFNGSSFEKLYAKYFCQARRIPLTFPDFSVDERLWMGLDNVLESQDALKGFPFVSTDTESATVSECYEMLRTGIGLGDATDEQLGLIRDLYKMMMMPYRLQPSGAVLEAVLHLLGRTAYRCYFYPNPRNQEDDSRDGRLATLQQQARAAGGEFTWTLRKLDVVPWQTMVRNIRQYCPGDFVDHLAWMQTDAASDKYIDDRDPQEALFLTERSTELSDVTAEDAEMLLGYLHLKLDQLDEAAAHLQRAIDITREDDSLSRATLVYDQSIVAAKQGDWSAASARCLEAIACMTHAPKYDECAALLVARLDRDGLPVFQELFDIRLVPTAKESLATFQKFTCPTGDSATATEP